MNLSELVTSIQGLNEKLKLLKSKEEKEKLIVDHFKKEEIEKLFSQFEVQQEYSDTYTRSVRNDLESLAKQLQSTFNLVYGPLQERYNTGLITVRVIEKRTDEKIEDMRDEYKDNKTKFFHPDTVKNKLFKFFSAVNDCKNAYIDAMNLESSSFIEKDPEMELTGEEIAALERKQLNEISEDILKGKPIASYQFALLDEVKNQLKEKSKLTYAQERFIFSVAENIKQIKTDASYVTDNKQLLAEQLMIFLKHKNERFDPEILARVITEEVDLILSKKTKKRL